MLGVAIEIPVLTSLRVRGSSIIFSQVYKAYPAASSLPRVGSLAPDESSLTNSWVRGGIGSGLDYHELPGSS